MSKKRLAGLVFALGVCGLLVFAYRADQAHRDALTSTTPTSGEILTGTWKADTGDLFQFRDDGSGRSRGADSGVSAVHYFEWHADASIFTIGYAPQGLLKSFLARSLGVETAQFSITDLSPESFTLVDNPSGISTKFSKAEDPELDRAP